MFKKKHITFLLISIITLLSVFTGVIYPISTSYADDTNGHSYLEKITVANGSESKILDIKIPVTNAYGIDISLILDSSVVKSAVPFLPGELSGCVLAYSYNSGRLNIGIASATPINVSQTLLVLKLDFNTPFSASSDILIENFTVNEQPVTSNEKIGLICSKPLDMNGDSKINIKDLVILSLSFGSDASNTSGRWDSRADLDSNGKIDKADFILFKSN